MATLYKQQIFCLHGEAGLVTGDIASDASEIPVDGDVLADATIVVGAQVFLRDAGVGDGDYNPAADSALMAIVTIGASSVTVDRPPGRAFDIGSAFRRAEHSASVWTENSALLTTCPENAAHPVREGSAFVADIFTPATVIIKQNDSGNTRPSAKPVNFVDVTPGETRVIDVSWPFPTTLSYIRVFVVAANPGDWVSLEFAPDTPSGYPTEAVAIGAVTFPVTPAMLATNFVRPGLRVKLMQPGPGGYVDTLGLLVAIDKNASTITVETPTVHAFTEAAIVLITYAPACQLPVPPVSGGLPTQFTVGNDAILGSEIPAGRIIRCTYHNGASEGGANSSLLAYFNYWT